MNRNYYFILLGLVMFFSQHTSAKEVMFGGREANDYYIDLLKHALSYFPDKNYEVSHYNDKSVTKARILKMLENEQEIDVMTGTATAEREATFQAIYFPILRGLKGWRLPLINKNTPELFASINTKEEFKKLVPAQFHTWTATTIFEHNDIKVTKAYNHKGVFLMLDKERVDYLPRSLLDIERVLLRYQQLNLMLDPYVLIKYPNAYYFYVNKNNSSLANDIKMGLEKSLADGSFEQMFDKAFGSALAQFKIKNRKVFKLINPFVLDSMPVERTELWADKLLN